MREARRKQSGQEGGSWFPRTLSHQAGSAVGRRGLRVGRPSPSPPLPRWSHLAGSRGKRKKARSDWVLLRVQLGAAQKFGMVPPAGAAAPLNPRAGGGEGACGGGGGGGGGGRRGGRAGSGSTVL